MAIGQKLSGIQYPGGGNGGGNGGGGGGGPLPPPAIDQNIIPQTPDVASFTKYGDIAMNLATGMANFSIPILNTKVGKLPLDITLSYGYSGLKPCETPSWVGLGWQLNVGGVITRSVRGLPDDDPITSRGFPNYDAFDDIPDFSLQYIAYNNAFLDQVMFNQRDVEPDVYSYSFPGHSGRFIIKNGNAITFPYDNIVISKLNSDQSFQVVTEDGTTYFFGLYGQIETTFTKAYAASNGSTYNSAWHLNEVDSPDKVDRLVFNYAQISYNDDITLNNQQVFYTSDTGPNYSIPSNTSLQTPNSLSTHIDGFQLISILHQNLVYSNNDVFISDISVSFDCSGPYLISSNSEKALVGITVSNSSNTIIKKAKFNYGFFSGNPILKLAEVDIIDPTSQPANPLQYKFNYENENATFPSLYTNGLDVFGYYNGQDANGNLSFSTPAYVMPPQAMNPSSGGNDRNPYLAYCKYGALSKITYPTGGYTILTYEMNSLSNTQANVPGSGLRIKSYVSVDPIANTSQTKTFSYFDQNGITSSIQFLSGCNMYSPISSYLNIGDLQDNSNPTNNTIFSTANLSPVLGDDNYHFHLENHPFFYSRVTEQDINATETHQTVYEFDCRPFGQTDIYPTATYQYKQTSTGFQLIHKDSLVYQIVTIATITGLKASLSATIPINTGILYNIASYTGVPYYIYSNWHQLTTKTDITFDDNGNQLTQVTNYYYENLLHKQMTKEVTTNSNGDIITTQYTYPFDYPPSSGCDKTAAETQFNSDLTSINQTYTACTNHRSLEDPTQFDVNNCESDLFKSYASILRTKDIAISNYVDCLVKNISWADPSLKALLTMQLNNNLNYNVEKIQSIQKAGSGSNSPPQFLAATKTEYVNGFTFLPNPSSVWSTDELLNISLSDFLANKSNYYKKRVNFTYDFADNIVSQQKVNDVAEVYLWGYNGKYPVAKVVGSDYATVTSVVSQAQIVAAGFDNTALAILLNNLRTDSRTKNALTTTYTYTPMVGITSQTDPAGHTINYEYDGFNRLKVVKDQNGDIIKQYDYQYLQP